MARTYPEQKVPVAFRVTPDTYEKIKQVAQAEQRSISVILQRFVEEALAQHTAKAA